MLVDTHRSLQRIHGAQIHAGSRGGLRTAQFLARQFTSVAPTAALRRCRAPTRSLSPMKGWRQAVRSYPYVLDTAVAALVYVITLIGPMPGRPHIWDPPSLQVALFGLVTAAALVFRRRWPVPVLAATVAVQLVHLAVEDGGRPLVIGVILAVYTVAAITDRQTALVAGALTATVVVAGRVLFEWASWLDTGTLALVAWAGMAVAAGDAVRNRRAYVSAVEERARRAEQTREEEAQRRVMAERLRIARDLHDVLAHHIAVINVQAGVAAHVLDGRPDQARQALAHIRQASRSALGELRTTVGLLRQAGDPAAPTEPTPGLDRLGDLVESFGTAGLRVEVTTSGVPRPLTAPVDLAAYRLVQEALTNVHKHAGVSEARIMIDYTESALAVEITDQGTATEQRNGGHGILGMRERVAVVGGTLDVGLRPTGGYRVHATLPLPEDHQ